MPYPLPTGDLPESGDLLYFFVAIPNDPAFTRAAWELYSGMGSPHMWGIEGIVADSYGAAELWRQAAIVTLEDYAMGAWQDILTKLDDILAKLTATSCCGDTIFVSDSFNTVIIPETGDPPATWGNGETVADWDDWLELVCGQANDFVDRLKAIAITLRELLELGDLTIGNVSDALRYTGFLGLLFSIASTIASSVYELLFAGGAVALDGIADDIEAARQDITCAILYGGDIAGAVEAAVGNVAWLALYSFIDYDSVVALIYEGGAEGQYLPVNRDDTCNCTGTLQTGIAGVAFTKTAQQGAATSGLLVRISAGRIYLGGITGAYIFSQTSSDTALFNVADGTTAAFGITAALNSIVCDLEGGRTDTSPDDGYLDLLVRRDTSSTYTDYGLSLTFDQIYVGSAWVNVRSIEIAADEDLNFSVTGLRTLVMAPTTFDGTNDYSAVAIRFYV